jgi:cardiolipin synthase A/B
MTRFKRLGCIVVGFVLVAFALMGLLSITRDTPVHSVGSLGSSGPPAVGDSLFERSFELFTGTHIFPGNSVQYLSNGNGSYPPLWADMRSARTSLTVQMYYSLPGKVADTMAAVLEERARAGVQVYFLIDAFGSQHLSREYLDSMRTAGVHVAKLRTLHWYTIGSANNRSHVRVVVVDGRVAYTGGFGLADYWLGDGLHPDQWRDSNVRFEGPAVMQLQAAFSAAWAEATGTLLTGPFFFPSAGFQPVGTMHAGLMFTAPTTGSTPAERFLALTIAGARKTLYITNSYFVPDEDFRQLLISAARRGVDVRVLTVNQNTDVKITWYAGRYEYDELLKGGVKIYEYQPSMMHSKTIVADGVWGEVGSMNFDNRSMAFNNEANVVVLDPGFGAQMDSIFMNDLKHTKQITLPSFDRRSRWNKILEWAASQLDRLL